MRVVVGSGSYPARGPAFAAVQGKDTCIAGHILGRSGGQPTLGTCEMGECRIMCAAFSQPFTYSFRAFSRSVAFVANG